MSLFDTFRYSDQVCPHDDKSFARDENLYARGAKITFDTRKSRSMAKGKLISPLERPPETMADSLRKIYKILTKQI